MLDPHASGRTGEDEKLVTRVLEHGKQDTSERSLSEGMHSPSCAVLHREAIVTAPPLLELGLCHDYPPQMMQTPLTSGILLQD